MSRELARGHIEQLTQALNQKIGLYDFSPECRREIWDLEQELRFASNKRELQKVDLLKLGDLPCLLESAARLACSIAPAGDL